MEDSYIYDNVNNIIVSYGVQSGPEMLRRAFYALGTLQYPGVVKVHTFPARLECHREWLKRLHAYKAEEILLYCERATSLAYRYLRKKNRAR